MSGWSGFPMSKCPMCILSRTISNGLSIVDFFLRSCWTETESSRDQVFVPTEWQRIGQRERGEGEEENKSRATLVLSMVIPQKERRWTEVWSLSPCSCPPSLTPLRQVGSSAFFFTEGTGSPSPDHPPSRFIVEKPDFDGWTEARARGLDLRNFLKSDSGDAWVRANRGRNSRGLENVLSLLQRRCWVKLWEDGGTSLSEKRCWDIYSFSVIGGCLFDAKIIV